MEPVEVVFTVVTVIAAGGATIIAWAARADALKAADRADTAEKAALVAMRETAAALATANELRVTQHEERVQRERRLSRVRPAEHALKWFQTLAAARATGVPHPAADDGAELAKSQLRATGEPAVTTLWVSLELATDVISVGDHEAAIRAGAVLGEAVNKWIESPERFELEADHEAINDRLLREHARLEKLMSRAAEHRLAAMQKVRDLEHEVRELDSRLAAIADGREEQGTPDVSS